MKPLLISALIGFTGMALIAEQTVPGNFLYPIKLNVNENIRHIIAVGPRAEARLALSLLKERLLEAETLADEGGLTPEVADEVGVAIAAQAARTVSAAENARADDDAALRTDLAKTLETFKNSLEIYKDTKLASSTEKLINSVEQISVSEDQTKKEVEQLKFEIEVDLARIENILFNIEINSTTTPEIVLLSDAQEEVLQEMAVPEASLTVMKNSKEKLSAALAAYDLFINSKEQQATTTPEIIIENSSSTLASSTTNEL